MNKLYWIGEESEIYTGSSLESILEYFDEENMWDSYNNDEYDELTEDDINNIEQNSLVKDEDGERVSFKELINEFEGQITQLTSQYW